MNKDSASKSIKYIIIILSIGMALYHLLYTQLLFQAPIKHQTTHLTFALLLIYFSLLRKNLNLWPVIVPLIVLSLITTGYIWINYEDLELRMGIPNRPDILIGIILVIIVFDSVTRSFGKVLPIIGGIFVAYTFLGQYLPQPFWHFPVRLKSAISQYNIGLHGMFGLALGVSANYIFLFMLFGALLKASGANKFFTQMGTLAGRKLAGGSGMAAVVSSALVGMISGSGMANVAITGQFTIPLMKSAGYRPEQAGAIESVASAGGSLMPPIMGIVAFIMAETMRVPYVRVCTMAIIPALLYYLCVGLFVQFNAAKLGITPMSEEIDRKTITLRGPLFVGPLAIIIVFLLFDFTPMYAAFAGIISLILIALVRKETRGTWNTWIEACVNGATTGAQVGAVSALIGIIMSSVTLTGLGLKFPGMVETLSGGTLWIALILVAIMTIILGCGMPPFASYLLVAILCVPALTDMGVPFIQAHFFVFFFAVFALITPPVGLCCVVAAPIAGADYLKVGIEAVKGALIAWFLPFLIIWSPGIILQEQGPGLVAFQLIASVSAVFLLQVSVVGYYRSSLSLTERMIPVLAIVALVAFLITHHFAFFGIGLCIGIAFIIWQGKRKEPALAY